MVYCRVVATYKNPIDAVEDYNTIKMIGDSNELGIYYSKGREFSGNSASTIKIGRTNFVVTGDRKRKGGVIECLVHYVSHIRKP